MKLNQIITSLLETDMYKFSMGQTIFHQFTSYKTTWTFKCRNEDVHFTQKMVQEITEQIKAFCKLRFTEDELAYLDNIKWIKGSYVDFLRLWQPRFEDFEIGTDAPCGLSIEAKGTWLNTSMYEIPTLAIVNEVYFRMAYHYDDLLASFEKKLDEKKVELHGDDKTREILGGCVIPAAEEDWVKEYLDYKLAVRVVPSMEEALRHIARYSSGHSECIITENYRKAREFTSRVDAAAVYVNASTRFTDGGEFGLGAEIGISTQKLHARGPMGLNELTSMKFIVLGSGQIR